MVWLQVNCPECGKRKLRPGEINFVPAEHAYYFVCPRCLQPAGAKTNVALEATLRKHGVNIEEPEPEITELPAGENTWPDFGEPRIDVGSLDNLFEEPEPPGPAQHDSG